MDFFGKQFTDVDLVPGFVGDLQQEDPCHGAGIGRPENGSGTYELGGESVWVRHEEVVDFIELVHLFVLSDTVP